MDLKNDIKDRLSIEDVVGKYVQLKRAGRNFKGLSPFTSEKTPSFVVSPEKQIWHDFSSNKGGDIFSFVMEVEGLDFKESLELLARQSGLNIDDYKISSTSGTGALKERLYLANKFAQSFFRDNLNKYPEAIEDFSLAADIAESDATKSVLHYQAARILYLMRQTDRASSILGYAIQLDSENYQARQLLDELEKIK